MPETAATLRFLAAICLAALSRLAAPAPRAVVVAASLVLGAGLGSLPARAAEPIRIALLPMVVHSADRPEYLRNGLADMLGSRFARLEDLDVVVIEDLSASTNKLEEALAVGRKANAQFVLFGSFTRFGTGASLDVQCAATSATEEEPLREIFVHSGSIGDVIPDLDDLVGKVARFVIEDYQERAVVDGDGALPSARALSDLRRRVEALEEALRGLSGQLGTRSSAGSGDVAAGPSE